MKPFEHSIVHNKYLMGNNNRNVQDRLNFNPSIKWVVSYRASMYMQLNKVLPFILQTVLAIAKVSKALDKKSIDKKL